MCRSVRVVGLVILMGALALAVGVPNVQPLSGVLSDRELAEVFGGGCSVGCLPDETLDICKGASFECPEAPGQEVYGTAKFTGCNTSGTAYSDNDIDTVESGSATGNTSVPLYTDTDCTTESSCYAGGTQYDQRWKDGQCKGFYPSWKCRRCSTMWTVDWETEKSWRCEDP